MKGIPGATHSKLNAASESHHDLGSLEVQINVIATAPQLGIGGGKVGEHICGV